MSWKHTAIVRVQQAKYVEADGNAVLVTSTDQAGYYDNAHYDAAGQKDLGIHFALGLQKISKK